MIEDAREWSEVLREQWICRTGIPDRLLAALRCRRDEAGRPLRMTEPRAELSALGDAWRFVVLHGPPGTGKTFAAASWLLACFDPDADRNGGWISAVDLAAIAPWEKPHERYLWIPDLVIDDAGAEGERLRDRVAAVLWHRYEHSRRTVVTTNLDAMAFERCYGDRITSRIAEVGAWIETRKIVRPKR